MEGWHLLSQAPFQLGPTDVTEAPTNHQKSVRGLNLQENNGKSMASHGTRFDEGRDVRHKYTNSEAVETEAQGRVPAIVTTVSMETEIGSCVVSWL